MTLVQILYNCFWILKFNYRATTVVFYIRNINEILLVQCLSYVIGGWE